MQPRSSARRLLRRVGVLLLVVGFVLALLTLRTFFADLSRVRSPVDDAPLAAGPVMVLGGEQARTVAALALDAVAIEGRELIASAGAADDLVALGRSCDEPGLRCVQPLPATTRGEARLAAALARTEGWSGLTVVTSSWHANRARLHFEACLSIPVAVVAVPEADPAALSRRTVWREALGALDARLRPECRDLDPDPAS
jgi:uncharacterized SAM-binding protein YcdF (DUF218 family)